MHIRVPCLLTCVGPWSLVESRNDSTHYRGSLCGTIPWIPVTEHAAVMVTRVVTHLHGLQRIYTAWVIAYRWYLSNLYLLIINQLGTGGCTQKAKACTSSLNCTVLLVLQYIGFKSLTNITLTQNNLIHNPASSFIWQTRHDSRDYSSLQITLCFRLT